ncbi:MAG: MotA/TolQ/ExbB proton channel family protein [Flavobacteriales bacterium]|jgi:biopolymer transport protein ExbB|nr:MotA/TolQ/ExbB proton channel family protein [Flavobacteriales bacterium]
MKKLFALLVVALMFTASVSAQDAAPTMETSADTAMMAADSTMADSAMMDSAAAPAPMPVAEEAPEMPEETVEVTGARQQIKLRIIEGGVLFMSFVVLCLIFGLALAIERIIYLNMATTNTKGLLTKVEDAMNSGGVDAAKEVCANSRGPVAAIFHQGLDRSGGSYEELAKAVEDYGSLESTKLERGLSWISLFIALAPMLGFMGTVIGMIEAFDKIAQANTINASIVAGGIKVALITTVSGLVVAIILQIFYNYILSKIDGIVFDMEEASMDLVDLVYRKKLNG